MRVACFSPAFMIFKIISSTKKDILRLGETRTQSQTENAVVEIFQVVSASLYQEPPCQNELGVTSVKIQQGWEALSKMTAMFLFIRNNS